jgi:hypothetical protein
MQSSNYYPSQQHYMMPSSSIIQESTSLDGQDDDSDTVDVPEKRSGRRKIKIEYINDKSRRHITFSKRKAGIMKKVRGKKNFFFRSKFYSAVCSMIKKKATFFFNAKPFTA